MGVRACVFSFHYLLYIILFNICSGHLFLVFYFFFVFISFILFFILFTKYSISYSFLHTFAILLFLLLLIFLCLNFSILLFLADHAVAGRVYVAVTDGPYTSTLIRVSPVCCVCAVCVCGIVCVRGVCCCEVCCVMWCGVCGV